MVVRARCANMGKNASIWDMSAPIISHISGSDPHYRQWPAPFGFFPNKEKNMMGPQLCITSHRHSCLAQLSKEMHEKFENAGSMKGGVVGQYADDDLLARKAMEIMMRAYASEAGNAMLKWLPYGGFYITGGIAVKNMKWITEDPSFKEVMFDKVRSNRCMVAMRSVIKAH
jgi:hypothetical protein